MSGEKVLAQEADVSLSVALHAQAYINAASDGSYWLKLRTRHSLFMLSILAAHEVDGQPPSVVALNESYTIALERAQEISGISSVHSLTALNPTLVEWDTAYYEVADAVQWLQVIVSIIDSC